MDRSIKRNVNDERLRKIAFTAAKQCGRSVIPEISETLRFKDYLEITSGAKLVFHESGNLLDGKIQLNIKNNNELNLIIGPEGDFSEKEIDTLKNDNATFLNLGNRRLRSETAVITALSQINLIFN